MLDGKRRRWERDVKRVMRLEDGEHKGGPVRAARDGRGKSMEAPIQVDGRSNPTPVKGRVAKRRFGHLERDGFHVRGVKLSFKSNTQRRGEPPAQDAKDRLVANGPTER